MDPRWIKTRDDKADRDKKIDLQKNRQTEKRQKTCWLWLCDHPEVWNFLKILSIFQFNVLTLRIKPFVSWCKETKKTKSYMGRIENILRKVKKLHGSKSYPIIYNIRKEMYYIGTFLKTCFKESEVIITEFLKGVFSRNLWNFKSLNDNINQEAGITLGLLKSKHWTELKWTVTGRLRALSVSNENPPYWSMLSN